MRNSFVDPKVEGLFPTPEIGTSAFAYIEERIREHEAIIKYYKGRHNAFTVTCQLPPEILGAIFLELAFSQCWSRRHIEWIRSVSHVCAHWRKVALSTTNLWSNIPVENKLWATEMISRSKNTPLTIVYGGVLHSEELERPSDCYAVLTEMLHHHLPRIKTFKLGSRILPGSLRDRDSHQVTSGRYNSFSLYHDDTSRERFVALLELLKQPASVMEHLEIYIVWQGYSENRKLSLELPRLRHLTLVGCAVKWKGSCFANLRSLNLSDLPQDIKPTIHELLDLLQRTPLLEEFFTSIKQSRELHDTPSHYRTLVHLQYLVCITITCSSPDCFFLFDHLDISRKAREINLNISSTQTNRKDVTSVAVLSDLARRIDNKCDGQVQELVVDDPLRFRISEDLSRLPSCTVVVKFISRGLEDREAFWQSLNLDQLSILNICEDFDSVGQWSIFGNLPDLKTIRISSENGHLLEALGRSTSPEPNTISLAFPALKHLTISWNTLAANDESGHRALDQIVSCLELRNSMGLALECLRLEGCFNDDDEESLVILNRLREYVEDVKTDKDGGDDDGFE